jgi:hypothetical protein
MSDRDELKKLAQLADERGDKETALAALKKLDAMPEDSTPKPSMSFGARLYKGVKDPLDAADQMLMHALPTSAVKKLDEWNNKIAPYSLGILDSMPEGGIDEKLKNDEAAYQAARQAAEPQNLTSLVTGKKVTPGIDWARGLGNVVSPVNLAAVSRLPRAVSIGGKILTGIGSGAVLGSLQPVTNGDFTEEKEKQVGIGAATGGLLPVATTGLGRVIKPAVSKAAQKLIDAGITPTPGQILGGGAKWAEEKLTSVPLLGDMIKSGQRRAVMDFNKAAINRALAPIGETLPKDMKAGNEAVDYTANKLGEAYDNLLPKLKVKADDQFVQDVQNIRKLAQNLPDTHRDQFERILKNEVSSSFTKEGLMSGETMKKVESQLGGMIRGYAKSDNYNDRKLGEALGEIQSSMRSMVTRNNSEHGPQLQNINEGWANFLRVQNAAGRIGSKEGVFSPASFRGAVKAMDSSRNKGSFARGKALNQDLADAAEKVLGKEVPDSGTAGRSILSYLLLGGGAAYVNPTAAVGAAAGMAPYTPVGQKLAAMLLTKRPQIAGPISKVVGNSSPALSPAAISLLSQNLQSSNQ